MRRNVEAQTKDRAREYRKIMSPAERRFWQHVRNKQLHGIYVRRQHPIGPYITDFFVPDLKIVIELDGHSHDTRLEKDAARDDYMKNQGYRVIRLQNEDVMKNLDGVLEYLWECCGHDLNPPCIPPDLRGEA
ncbi:MAG TPA: endonuclease domain-containing protein [bacterium]|nr:endonuclease domain-containing protein [bacterium]